MKKSQAVFCLKFIAFRIQLSNPVDYSHAAAINLVMSCESNYFSWVSNIFSPIYIV